MAWPDRFGLGALWLVALACAALNVMGWSASDPPMVHVDQFAGSLTALSLVFALPAWIVARILDFVLGGPQRRRAARPISN